MSRRRWAAIVILAMIALMIREAAFVAAIQSFTRIMIERGADRSKGWP